MICIKIKQEIKKPEKGIPQGNPKEGKGNMYTVQVNGKMYEAETDKKLMRFLRDDLHLTSVKDGCSQGACGTCTVLVDGKTTRACIPMISKMEGKSIVTVEGLSER